MLKNGTPDQISAMYIRLNNEVKSLLNSVVELTYFMRGGMKYDHILYGMSYIEREIAFDYVSKRLELEFKSPHPNY
jgi:hypothetical protein